ncbi:MAG: polysaccharide deacetylase family protein, partial [Nitrososphaerota archaeon]|nr:polysaccharide deacetylase family protein [Nitrososphaerota archaeon]
MSAKAADISHNMDSKMIALTFDDGPSEYTDRLLDILSENDAKATFFVTGSAIDAYSDVVIRAVSQGCEIAGHTWSHRDLTTLTVTEIRQELQNTNDAIFNSVGVYPDMFRPSYGAINNNVVSVSEDMNLAIILWTITALDWQSQDADAIYEMVVDNVRDGVIVLCHDTVEATIDAMERVIPELVLSGYNLVTVSELLDEKEAGQLYANSVNGWDGIVHTVQSGDS